AAVAAARAVGYENAGTVEFIVDENRKFYFLEMNTRLQVEHPITEFVTGLDLVRLQIEIAAGEKLPFSQNDLIQRGHAIECRIYAEDPANDFLPDTGEILLAQSPHMPNVRVDTGIETGDSISTFYDPMIAKLITYGSTRDAAIQQMQLALREYVILGLTTNIAFLQDVFAHEAFRAGKTPTNFIPQHLSDWQPATLDHEELDFALIASALHELHTQPNSSTTGNAAGDLYSPWNQTDRFRIGESR
ncbi:MAG TPA: acetyl-CoA carboxylase biotin carboxylase subunit, partial [Aggregatilineales bacterium]|nr:acetyl-CoA carboxylase biotin carboxylase subunit [Aggregatilineales bacterium]